MPLNEKQIRILQVIDAGNNSGNSIAEALGSSMQMLRYYLDTMAEDGYLKAAKVYDNNTREFQIVRAYLTPEGKAALDRSSTPTQNITPVAEVTQSLNPKQTNPNQLLVQDLSEIIKALDVLLQVINQLPEGRKELAIVYLDDLQEEIKISYRRRPQRIKAYFLAVVGIVLPVLKQIDNANDFLESTKYLSRKLNIPVKLPQN
jgi:DeoR family transcriptional regulator, catabolite repression regulator